MMTNRTTRLQLGIVTVLLALTVACAANNDRHMARTIRFRSDMIGKSLQKTISISGGSRSTKETPIDLVDEASLPLGRSLAVAQYSTFLLLFSASLVAFLPAPALIAKIGTERATSTLSALSSSAALFEIILSPALGSVLDSVGRKPALVCASLALAIVNSVVSINPSVVSICAAKFVASVCFALFLIAIQAVISDVAASNSELMSSALGKTMSLAGAGFMFGAIAGGKLSEFGVSIAYGISAIGATLTALLVCLGMYETLLPSKKVQFEAHVTRKLLLQSPLSCTRILFRHSKQVRILAIILMLQNLPNFMGDVMQILAKNEWNLSTKDFSSLFATIGMFSIVANTVSSVMVRKIGIKRFTGIATFSSMLAPIGASLFSFRGYIAGLILGFIGMAQTLGVIAALVSEGDKSGIPQGELAGERASFIAIIKVIGPIGYSMMYVQGKRVVGSPNLPFLFNICLAAGAFTISQLHLS